MSTKKKNHKKGPAQKKEVRQRPTFKQWLNSPLPIKKLQMLTFADAFAFFIVIDVTLFAIMEMARYYPSFSFWIFAIMLIYLPLVYLYNYLRYHRFCGILSLVVIGACLGLLIWLFPKYSLVYGVNNTGFAIKDAGASQVTFVQQVSYPVPLAEKGNFFCKNGYTLEYEVDGVRTFYTFNPYTGTYTRLTDDQSQEILDEEAANEGKQYKSFVKQLLGLD